MEFAFGKLGQRQRLISWARQLVMRNWICISVLDRGLQLALPQNANMLNVRQTAWGPAGGVGQKRRHVLCK